MSNPLNKLARLHPAAIALLAALAVLVVALVPTLWRFLAAPPVPAQSGAQPGVPWAVERLPDGATQVFGLRLPGSTLADARSAWGDGLQIALMASQGRPAVLEGYVESWRGGPFTGRLILTADVAPAALERWRERAAKEMPASAETRRITLHADDDTQALRAPLVGIGFIPTVQLDADMLRQRFGEPAQRLRSGEHVEHWLYPERGLAIVLDAQGSELLQYVAPADFERRLRAPLRDRPASSAAGLSN